MRSLLAFTRKEMMEQLRSGRLLILGMLFTLFGIMNPATAKLTPWLFQLISDSLAESGVTIAPVTVSALDSWVQFFKNMPMALIAFTLLESGIFTREYQAGTLVLPLTKGLERHKVVVSKAAVLAALWTACYWLCFGVTYAYNAYFWDNSAVRNIPFSATCWWLFGLWVVSLMTLLSTALGSNTSVLVSTGGVVFVMCLLDMLPKVQEYLPTRLADGNPLISGAAEAGTYVTSLTLAVGTGAAFLVASVLVFNRRQL